MTAAVITASTANTYHICEAQIFQASTDDGTPITAYVWSTDGLQLGQGTATATYSFDTTCAHTVSVTITAGGVDYTADLDLNLTLALSQICTAIKDTLEGAMSASLLARAYNFDELPEGINDAPSLMVYWQSTVNDALRGETDRWTFANRRVKDLAFHVDFFANPRNNLDENNATLTEAASEIIDILEMEALSCAEYKHCPPFGLCGLKTFLWQGERVVFDWGGVLYFGARFIITVRTY